MSANVGRENLPKSMRYAMTSVPAVQADCTLARFDSTNGVLFSPTGANDIRIRVRSDGFLVGHKHYLQFKLNGTNAGFIDGDAGSFIERLTIEANGTQIEQVDRYGLYNGIRKNYNTSAPEIYRKNSQAGGALLGCDASDEIKLGNLGAAIGNASANTFCIQLNSGFIMNTFNKALPMGMAEIEIILRLRSNTGALVNTGADAGTTPTYTISEPRIYAPVYRIQNPSVMSSYNQLASSGISWVGDTVKTYVNSVNNVSGPQTLQINDRSQSLKALDLVTALLVKLRKNTADIDSLNNLHTYRKTTFIKFQESIILRRRCLWVSPPTMLTWDNHTRKR